MVLIIIQARMSSARFPGKVLAPINGNPMVECVINGAARVVDRHAIIVATSEAKSDDPLALYVQSLGVRVFRGPLQDVYERYQLCLQTNPCDWFFRINADSPLINSSLIKSMMSYIDGSLDLITNVQKRTFPHGHSAELLRVESFAAINPSRLTAEDREHVTSFYYSHADEFRILNLENTDSVYAGLNFVVDTLDDLRRVEALQATTPYDFMPRVRVTGR